MTLLKACLVYAGFAYGSIVTSIYFLVFLIGASFITGSLFSREAEVFSGFQATMQPLSGWCL